MEMFLTAKRLLGRMRRRRAAVGAVAVAAALAVFGCGDGGGGGSGSLKLMRQATERARAAFPDALLVQIVALPGAEGLVEADDTKRWEFDFMIADLSRGLAVTRDGGVWSEPVEVPAFFGVVFDDLNRVALDLGDALDRLRAEGYADAYDEWNLFQPLVSGNPPPFYYFYGGTDPYPGVILRVDAMTGAVEYDPPPGA